jgi:hypothetical protein
MREARNNQRKQVEIEIGRVSRECGPAVIERAPGEPGFLGEHVFELGASICPALRGEAESIRE